MIDKEIIINKQTRAIVNGENGDLFRLGVDGENLQENIIFKFDDEFVNGTARVEITMQNNTKSYVMTTKENESYILPIKSVITKKGLNRMQLVITQGTNDEEIPIFKSRMFGFFIDESINADTEQPEGYPQWLDQANTKLNEMDNFDIDAVKEENVATMTITDRYGIEKSVEIYDGLNGINGKDAKINGVNTLRMVAGENITIDQQDDVLTINSQGGGGSGAVTSVNGQTGDVVIEIPDVSNFITKDVNDLTYYEPKATTGNNLVASIDSSTYVMTISLRNSNNEILNSQTIDLPLETMVVSGSYDSESKKIILTLKNGNTIEFSVADLVSGLQTEITSNNKLSADLVDDTNTTNKFFSGNYNDLSNKPDLSGYQTTIDSDNKLNADLVDDSTSENKFQYVGGLSEVLRNNYLDFKKAKKGLYYKDYRGDILYYYSAPFGNQNIASSITIRVIQLAVTYDISTLTQAPSSKLYFAYAMGFEKDGGVSYWAHFYIGTNGQISYDSSTNGNSPTISYLLNDAQYMYGQKTFDVTPKINSYSAPTQDTHLAPKKYVDDKVATKMTQYSTMPTASVDYLDKIVEYIGTTDSTYTNGYFYKCVSDGESTPTYSWEQIEFPISDLPITISTIPQTNNSTSYIIFNELKEGLYDLSQAQYSNNKLYYKVYTTDQTIKTIGNATIIYYDNLYMYYTIKEAEDYLIENTSITTFKFGIIKAIQNDGSKKKFELSLQRDGTLQISGTNSGETYYLFSSSQTISGEKTFSTIPKQSNTNAPTQDAQFTNKKYVDDQISAQIGNINTILATLTTPSSNASE